MGNVEEIKTVVVSVSPQSRASIAAYFNLTAEKVTILTILICIQFLYYWGGVGWGCWETGNFPRFNSINKECLGQF